MTDAHRYSVLIDGDKAGLRLDKALADALPDLSRARLQALMADGRISDETSGRAVTSASRKVQAGERFVVIVPPPMSAEPEAQDIPLAIIFEDDHLLVLDKPAGLVVHPAAGNADGTLVNALLAHCGDSLTGIGGVERPGIVHRLDKGTSGLMVVAKTETAHRGLVDQFSRHDIERAYVALVHGVPHPSSGTVDAPIGRHPKDRKRMAIIARGGRRAVTHYRVERPLAGGDAALVECRLETGRTHQIRVHMTSLGHGLLGDPVYGGRGRLERRLQPSAETPLSRLDHQALHARVLGFHHPETGQPLHFEQEYPEYFKELVDFLELS
ncbi:MAG: RluA family pseudouridine synthase [Rhodospirillales bacterium]